jgi:hypothetical protein
MKDMQRRFRVPKPIERIVVLGSLLAVISSGAVIGKDIYVGGNSPHPTIASALAEARALPVGEPRRILVHSGAYYNTEVRLTSEDSGLTIENMPGEAPVLYGGEPLTGWEPEGKFQAAHLPTASGENALSPRLLLVNGESRPRARFPATNTLPHETRFDVPWMSTTGGGWKRPPTHEELTTLQYRTGDLGDWLEITNAEITVFHMWDESCVGVASHDVARRTLTLAPELGHPPGAFGVQKYVLWNIKEGMTSLGQWYHDRARQRLVYWPRPGEDMRRATVIAPTRPVLFSIRGTRQQPVRGITLRGLTLSATTVPLVAGGFGAARFDGAVSLSEAEDCVLESLVIKGVAGQAINGNRLRNIRVEHCDIEDCGAGGVYVGGTKVVIRNNHIRKVGRSYPSAIGIFRGGNECLISHNEVHDCTYSAINYGGRSNIIEGNLIYDCMKVLHDGAAIYVFGGKNTVLRGNLARDFADYGGYGASAYYLDEQCSGCVVEGNVSLRVNWPSHNHMATNNIIRDNLFIVEGDAKITFPRSTGYTFARNVLYAAGKIRFEGTNAVSTWMDNLLYSGKGRFESVGLNQYSATSTVTNPPPNCVVADPQFMDPARGDYRYRPDSPALKLALRPLDVSTAGRLPE